MTQVFFASATTPLLTDLDGNMNDLYGLVNLTTQFGNNGSFYGTPTLTQASGWKSFFINSVAISTNGSNSILLGTNMGGTIPAPTYLTATAASYYQQSAGNHIWTICPSGSIGAAMTFTTAMKLDTSGNLWVGAGTTNPGVEILPTGAAIWGNSAAATGFAFETYTRSGVTIGSVTQSGTTAVLYNTTSDERLKDNIADAIDSGAILDAVKVRQYDWKSDGSHQRFGFIAQELVAVVPEAVHSPADPDDMMAVDYSKLVPLLVKEVQSLRARLAAANIA